VSASDGVGFKPQSFKSSRSDKNRSSNTTTQKSSQNAQHFDAIFGKPSLLINENASTTTSSEANQSNISNSLEIKSSNSASINMDVAAVSNSLMGPSV
jgi:hypothetical protein